jgi:hypothetical protein
MAYSHLREAGKEDHDHDGGGQGGHAPEQDHEQPLDGDQNVQRPKASAHTVAPRSQVRKYPACQRIQTRRDVTKCDARRRALQFQVVRGKVCGFRI